MYFDYSCSAPKTKCECYNFFDSTFILLDFGFGGLIEMFDSKMSHWMDPGGT